MADRGEEAGLRLVGQFGTGLGLGQLLVERGQFAGALLDPQLEALVGLLERILGLAVGGDVGERHDEAAAGHRVADQLDHPAVGQGALGGVRSALAHPVQALGHVDVRVALAAQAAFGVVADDVGDRPADADQALGVLEQFQIAAVPGHQAQRLVDHADALGNVLDRPLQQRAVELQNLRGLVDDAHDVLDLHVAAFDGGLDHRTGRGGAKHAGEQALGVGDPFAAGGLAWAEALALAVGEADEALSRAFLADEAGGQVEQVLHLHRQQQARAGTHRGFLADEAAGLPVLGDAGAREQGNQHEHQEVAGQRQQGALGQGVHLQAQRVAGQPLLAGEDGQRPAQAIGEQR
ncbi:hypothetical protein D9M71_343210 [compost metagenome]